LWRYRHSDPPPLVLPVMAGLDPAIQLSSSNDMDARLKAGHDE
jgi:hypothetical protein